MNRSAHDSVGMNWSWRLHTSAPTEEAQLIALLRAIADTGSLAAAARTIGVSYRSAWGRIERWQSRFERTLVESTRGDGSRLSPFATRLLALDAEWSQRLAREMEAAGAALRSLMEGPAGTTTALKVIASHDMALSQLRDLGQLQGLRMDLHYRGSLESLAEFARGECDAAGFHCPDGPLGEQLWQQYRNYLKPRHHALLLLGRRTQGLMVQPGNPHGLHNVDDLARPGVRFLNRQPGAGTRLILDMLLAASHIPAGQIAGYESEEFTHAAVAALIASDQADAGFGIEAAARQCRLDFVPLLTERYFLAVERKRLQEPALVALRSLMQSPEFLASAGVLAGYDLRGIARVLDIDAEDGSPARLDD